MTTTEQIEARLAESLLVYQEIREMVKEWEMLQGTEQMRAEYDRQTSTFDTELTELEKRKGELQADKRRLQLTEEGGVQVLRPPILHARLKPILPTPRAQEQRAQPTGPNQNAIQEARLRLKKMIGRWGRALHLSLDVQGSINSIADDPKRPLGEALILLDWDAFKKRISSSEGEAQHLERLSGWGEALVEYRQHLRGETDMLRTKYRRVLPLLELWLGRKDEEGRKKWERRIEETRAVKQEEIERLKAEINQLTSEIEEIQRRFPRASV